MPSLNDYMDSKSPSGEGRTEEVYADAEVVEDEVGGGRGKGLSLSFLKAETGEGSIDDYLDHPLNVTRSRALAQVLRGLTGMLGSLKLAIIDIVMGGISYAKENKKGGVSGVANGIGASEKVSGMGFSGDRG